MHRAVVVGFALSGLVAGCVKDDTAALYIAGDVRPEPTTCEVSTTNQFYLRGVLNVAARPNYLLNPVYRSQLLQRSGTAPLRSDPNGMHIRYVVVELQDSSGDPIYFGAGNPNPFSIVSGDFVPAAAALNSPGSAVGSAEIIPSQYRDYLYKQWPPLQGGGTNAVVVASVAAIGETLGGVEVKGSAWYWPIDVCTDIENGTCLFRCPADGSDEEDVACIPGQNETSEVLGWVDVDGTVLPFGC